MESRGLRSSQNTMFLDHEAVLGERLNTLKNSVSADRGHLTRFYGEMKELMLNLDNYNETMKRREAFDQIFASYKEASLKYSRCLTRQEERQAVAKQESEELRRYRDFVEMYAEWLRILSTQSMVQNRQVETQGQVIPFEDEFEITEASKIDSFRLTSSVPKGSIAVPDGEISLLKNSDPPIVEKQRVSASHTNESQRTKSKGSRSNGSSSKRTKQSLAAAQLTLKQLTDKQELTNKQQDLEKKMNERKFIMEMKRLEIEKEIVDAQAAVGKCALQSQSSDENDELERKSAIFPGLQKQDLHQTMERFFMYNELPTRLTFYTSACG